MRKTRSDSVLDRLTPERSAQLKQWMAVEKLPYPMILVLIRKKWELTVSASQLSRYWQRHAPQWFLDRLRDARGLADQIGEELSQAAPQLESAALASLKQLTFEAIASEKPDMKNLKGLLSILIKNRKLDLEENKLRLLIRKYEEQTEKAKAVLENAKTKGGITPETITEIEQTLNLL